MLTNPGLIIQECSSCAECKKLIGLSVLRYNDGLFTLFRIIMERWREAPETIIYDNCCNFHVFCSIREPRFFAKTRFFVDRFHWPNHNKCSGCYNLDNYNDPVLQSINSERAEQFNARLRVVQHVQAMSQVHYLVQLLHHDPECIQLGPA
jgi:hypothetical protein